MGQKREESELFHVPCALAGRRPLGGVARWPLAAQLSFDRPNRARHILEAWWVCSTCGEDGLGLASDPKGVLEASQGPVPEGEVEQIGCGLGGRTRPGTVRSSLGFALSHRRSSNQCTEAPSMPRRTVPV